MTRTGRRKDPHGNGSFFDRNPSLPGRILRLTGIAIGVIDPVTRKFEFINEKWTELLGFTDAELSRKTLEDLLDPREEEENDPLVLEVLSGKESATRPSNRANQSRLRRFLRKDGSSFLAALSEIPIQDDAGETFAIHVLLDDLDGPIRIEESLEDLGRRYRRLSSLHESLFEVFLLLTRSSGEPELLSHACRIVHGMEHISLALVVVPGTSSQSPGVIASSGDPALLASPDVHSQISSLSPGQGAEPAFPEFLPAFGLLTRTGGDPSIPLRSYARLPLFRGGSHYGDFLIVSDRPELFSSGEIRLLRKFTDGLSRMLDQFEEEGRRILAEQRLTRKTALYDALHRLSSLAARRSEEERLLQETCRIFMDQPNISSVILWESDQVANGIRPRFFEGEGTGANRDLLSGLFLSADPGHPHRQFPVIQETLLGGRAGVANDLPDLAERSGNFEILDLVRRMKIHSAVTIPVRRGGRITNILNVNLGIPDYFDPDLVTLALEAGEILSGALDALDSERDRQNAESRLLRSGEEFRRIFDHSPDPTLILRNKRFVMANEAAARAFGFDNKEDFLNLHPADLSPEFQTDGASSRTKTDHMMQIALEKGIHRFEWVHRRRDGTDFWTEVTLSRAPVTPTSGFPENAEERQEEDRSTFYVIVRDISEQKKSAEHLRSIALHDPLTGLPNRLALEQYLSKAIPRAQRKNSLFALGILDLDDLKTVNDTAGHGAGDRLLREFAGRLGPCLRKSDFLARIGGDEFVVVIEELENADVLLQLGAVMDRFQRALESPIEISTVKSIVAGMSMGLSLFPRDGEDGETLLRKADAAMYRIKVQKLTRLQWWQLASFDGSAPDSKGGIHDQAPGFLTGQEESFDGYGIEAATLLEKNRSRFEQVIDRFSEAFYTQLVRNPGPRAILAALQDHEMQALAHHQSEHLRFLLDPKTTRPMVIERATHLGHVHTLVGVDGAILTQAMALYRRLLFEFLHQALLSARERHLISLVSEVRLQDDIQTELDSGTFLIGEYFNLLSRSIPLPDALWADIRTEETDAMGRLSGIRGVLLLRPDREGNFVVENSAGPVGNRIAKTLGEKEFVPVVGPNAPTGQGLIGQAWRGATVRSSPSYSLDPRLLPWREAAGQLGIRSAVTIPVKDEKGEPVAAICLLGGFPNQFESAWMQQFTQGLERRWAKIWAICRPPKGAIREDVAAGYRKALFSGGLSMFMQPVIDLATGQVVRVEALSRLVEGNGGILFPESFLPALGDIDLDRLFRMGLEETLSCLSRWDSEGLEIGISLNLPPSTLRDPDIPRWVHAALGRSGIAPGRLTLELLESGEMIHRAGGKQAIDRLREAGVTLSMDDLGSGYSSLLRLSSLPFDSIKVDQGLLKRIRSAPLQTMSLIRTIIQMGQDFGCEVVVEGLEDAGMVETAVFLGASHGQGYALARPMPADQIFSFARTFILPIQSGRIRTFLGALAFHWRSMHSDSTPEKRPYSGCPLTAFFGEEGQQGTLGNSLHEELHRAEQKSVLEISRKLTLWLTDQVREEGTAME